MRLTSHPLVRPPFPGTLAATLTPRVGVVPHRGVRLKKGKRMRMWLKNFGVACIAMAIVIGAVGIWAAVKGY